VVDIGDEVCAENKEVINWHLFDWALYKKLITVAVKGFTRIG